MTPAHQETGDTPQTPVPAQPLAPTRRCPPPPHAHPPRPAAGPVQQRARSRPSRPPYHMVRGSPAVPRTPARPRRRLDPHHTSASLTRPAQQAVNRPRSAPARSTGTFTPDTFSAARRSKRPGTTAPATAAAPSDARTATTASRQTSSPPLLDTPPALPGPGATAPSAPPRRAFRPARAWIASISAPAHHALAAVLFLGTTNRSAKRPDNGLLSGTSDCDVWRGPGNGRAAVCDSDTLSGTSVEDERRRRHCASQAPSMVHGADLTVGQLPRRTAALWRSDRRQRWNRTSGRPSCDRSWMSS